MPEAPFVAGAVWGVLEASAAKPFLEAPFVTGFCVDADSEAKPVLALPAAAAKGPWVGVLLLIDGEEPKCNAAGCVGVTPLLAVFGWDALEVPAALPN